ncbi:uncharacterized protein LOC143836900 [Paroedura picta]|uniref:uncharacterized protein LOC143836900 n=1 Tax=Paroedura picta TaxID=143630 RepID=UPI004055D490
MASKGERAELLIHSFVAVSMLGLLACLLALCALCRRKHSKQDLPQDGMCLVEAPALRSTELGESAPKPQMLKRADPQGKNRRPASFNFQLPPREDDGTTSVSSFPVIPQWQLPQIPSKSLQASDETYSNLTFPGQAQEETLYESVTITGGGRNQPGLIQGAEGLPRAREDQPEYARVAKVKDKEEPPQGKVRGSQGTPPQQPQPAETPTNPPAVQVEEMYSVVNKAGKKKKKTTTMTDFEGEEGERSRHIETSHQNGQLTAVHQEPDSGAQPGPSSPFSPASEPCYESVSCESWRLPDGRGVSEPAYETVDAHWKPPRGKGNRGPNKPENLYESI